MAQRSPTGRQRPGPRRRAAAAAAALALLAAACGGGGGDPGGEAATSPTSGPSGSDPTVTTPAPPTTAPAPPSTAPAQVPEALRFTATGLDGAPVRGADYAGRDVALWFWAPW